MTGKSNSEDDDINPSPGDVVEIYSKKGYANAYSTKTPFSFGVKFFSVYDGERGLFIERMSNEPTSILYNYGKVFFHKNGGVGALLIFNLKIVYTKKNLEEESLYEK